MQWAFHRYFMFIIWMNLTALWLTLTWVLLGLIVNPLRALPYATASLTMGLHSSYTYKKLVGWKEMVTAAFKDVFESIMKIVPMDLARNNIQKVRGCEGVFE